jgi:hypothetical protein
MADEVLILDNLESGAVCIARRGGSESLFEQLLNHLALYGAILELTNAATHVQQLL